MDKFEEGLDYYFNADGLIVLTKHYHTKRGYCCGNGCVHCPYEFINVREPKRSALLKKRQSEPEDSTGKQND